MFRTNDRSVFGDLNARSELEVIDNIYDRTIITTNSANILNIMAETSALNPDEEVIRKRGRKKTPKVSQLPLRRSPRKANHSATDLSAIESSTQSDVSHDYFLRTPTKNMNRTPSKRLSTPSKSLAATPLTPRRVSPRKRLQLDGNDSGIGLTPSPVSNRLEFTPTVGSSTQKSMSKTKTKSSMISKRRRRRYF